MIGEHDTHGVSTPSLQNEANQRTRFKKIGSLPCVVDGW